VLDAETIEPCPSTVSYELALGALAFHPSCPFFLFVLFSFHLRCALV
jgi:hypothetical protein